MNEYHRKERQIMNVRSCRNFSQIIGEHAVAMCELAKADKNNNKRGLMENWVNVYKLNVEWAQKVCRNEHPDSEFYLLTHKLIDSYSTCLADYILDRRGTDEWKKRMSYLVEKETEFFNTIGNGNQDAKKQWLAYTGSIIKMTNSIHEYGLHSEMHYNEATDTLRNAVCLGQWLDYSLRTHPPN
jgi:hypothetical protein